MPDQYYERFIPEREYEEHLFIAGRGLQSAELNEIQKQAAHRLRGVADVLFKDGAIVRDASCKVDPNTGAVECQSGALYIRGSVRGVAPATFTIPIVGTIAIGIRLVESVVTVLEDPGLRDPATGTRNYDEPGAARLKVHAQWGWDGDGSTLNFFPVYSVTNGILDAKDPPPSLDAVTQALARYDRDSAGGSYVVSGLRVSRLADREDGYQVFIVDSGRARVNGFSVDIQNSRRLARNAQPLIRFIDSEPRTSTTVGSQRINVDRTPIANVTQVRITAEKTATINHGTVTGAQDPIPDTSVISIIEVKQGGTTYVAGTDYQLTAGKVDWTLAGAEPAPGSSYTVKYQYITTVTPTAQDDTGFTITGAVAGSLVLSSYNVKLPRVDRLCINDAGQFVWIDGISSDYEPVRPPVPSNLLPLAYIVQFWTGQSYLINDGVRVVPMQDIEAINTRLDNVVMLVSQQKLQADAAQREAATKKGMFVDPFLTDDLRDQGLAQTAAVVDGELILAITATPLSPVADITEPQRCAHTRINLLSQSSMTGGMKINPFMAFAPPPAQVALTPAIDRWTETVVSWTSPITRRFTQGFNAGQTFGNLVNASDSTSTSIQSEQSTRTLQHLRQISVAFEVRGFGAGETLASVTFDGLSVTPHI